MNNRRPITLYILYVLAFLEGGGVMACELLGAKLIAPFFGNSLYVWAGVLGVTLTALMCGYYLGGYLAGKFSDPKLVFWLLLISGVLVLFMPYLSRGVMENTLGMGVKLGATLSLFAYMFPPLILLASTPPLIIQTITSASDSAGQNAGSIYGISTSGGIISTFLIGFYLLPEAGISLSSIIYGSLLVLLPLTALLRENNFWGVFSLIPLLFVLFHHFGAPETFSSDDLTLKYDSEGILGQVRVVDFDNFPTAEGSKPGRVLLVNNTAQTIMNKNKPRYSLWRWAYYFPAAVSTYPEGSDALLLGLGGGSLVKQLRRLGFHLDVVEIDHRIEEVAKKYFFVDQDTNVIIDDARHYLNTTKKSYDVIVYDLFLNETPPAHVFTLEAFRTAKEKLNRGGTLMINFYGFISGEKGRASRSVYKTLKKAGFSVSPVVTPGAEKSRNLILLASQETRNVSNITYNPPHRKKVELGNHMLEPEVFDLKDAVILRDDRPVLEKMYLPAALEWRRNQNHMYLQRLRESPLPLFR